jgi:hypothetical protein
VPHPEAAMLEQFVDNIQYSSEPSKGRWTVHVPTEISVTGVNRTY